jgi:phage replication O-like protein O
MANPQPDQFTRLSNELLEAMCMVQLSGQEWCIVHTVIRKTYGYNKKSDWISSSQITQATGLIKQRINEAKKKLIAKKILIQDGRRLSLNKDYDQWIESNGKALLGNGKALLKVTEKRPHNRKKDNSTKDNISEQSSVNKNNLKDMWKQYEEPTIDADTGEEVESEDAKVAAQTRKENDEMRKYIKGLRNGLNLPPLDPKQMNWQLKDYRILLKRGWSHKNIGEAFVHIATSDLWKEKMQNGEYPGMNTVEFSLRNKSAK